MFLLQMIITILHCVSGLFRFGKLKRFSPLEFLTQKKGMGGSWESLEKALDKSLVQKQGGDFLWGVGGLLDAGRNSMRNPTETVRAGRLLSGSLRVFTGSAVSPDERWI